MARSTGRVAKSAEHSQFGLIGISQRSEWQFCGLQTQHSKTMLKVRFGPVADKCARWLVVWDDAECFYARVGTEALDDMLRKAAPELAKVRLNGECF